MAAFDWIEVSDHIAPGIALVDIEELLVDQPLGIPAADDNRAVDNCLGMVVQEEHMLEKLVLDTEQKWEFGCWSHSAMAVAVVAQVACGN